MTPKLTKAEAIAVDDHDKAIADLAEAALESAHMDEVRDRLKVCARTRDELIRVLKGNQ